MVYLKKFKFKFLVLAIVALSFYFPFKAGAYQIEQLQGVEIKNDFTLGPSKIEAFMDPGEELVKNISITNRTGHKVYFKVSKEDFEGSPDSNSVTVFLGDKKGKFSLKDWLNPEADDFYLEHGQEITLPVKISVPKDAEPGGYYAAVFIGSYPDPTSKEGQQIKIVSRVGSLFFVRVKGQVTESGFLKEFSSNHYYQKGPIEFNLVSQNDGNVHLNPYGIIEIKNILGKKISEIKLDPWFVMPDISRLRKISWDRGFLLGRYTATAKINRGYQDIIDEKSVSFWVVPWKILAGAIITLLVIVYLFYWIFSHFEIKRK